MPVNRNAHQKRLYGPKRDRDLSVADAHLQEVVARPPTAGGDVPLLVGHGGEDAESRLELLVDRHDGRDVAASVAVVWRRPDGDDRLLREVELAAR